MAQLLVVPAVGLPILGLLRYNSQQEKPEDRVPASFLLKTWALSGFIGPPIAAPVQLALGWPIGKLLFGSKLDDYLLEMGRTEDEIKLLSPETLATRREIAFSLPNLASNLFLSTIAPLVEEILKYAALKIVERYFPEKTKTKRNYVLIAMAVGVGFALVENLAFIQHGMRPGTSSTRLAITIIERAIAGTCGHLLTSALTGCKFAESRGAKEKKTSMWVIIKESLLYHGLGNFGLFTITSLYGNVGWVHPRDLAGVAAMITWVAGVNITAGWRVNQELKKIDEKSAQKDS